MLNMMFHNRYSNIVTCIAAICLYTAGRVAIAQSTEFSLGEITTRMHNVAGEVVLLSERVLEVRGFVYDNEAPAVYFWADTNSVPSSSGFRLNDGSPTNGCGIMPLNQEATGTEPYRVEFPDNKTIFDLLGGSISLWCESFSVNFGEVVIPTSLLASDIPATSSGPDVECASSIEEAPVASPTSAVFNAAPAKSSSVSAPTMSSSSAAAGHKFGHTAATFSDLALTATTVSFLYSIY